MSHTGTAIGNCLYVLPLTCFMISQNRIFAHMRLHYRNKITYYRAYRTLQELITTKISTVSMAFPYPEICTTIPITSINEMSRVVNKNGRAN